MRTDALCLCGDCHHFVQSSLALEAEIPGLAIVSSAFGAVRDDTGLCRYHDQFFIARDTCDDFLTCMDDDSL
ncbi:MAG: hypothetical protein HQL54_05280 [Magnetococcales bacterium]|nr:hypothetical protein [Magnetococcales bacterium]